MCLYQNRKMVSIKQEGNKSFKEYISNFEEMS